MREWWQWPVMLAVFALPILALFWGWLLFFRLALAVARRLRQAGLRRAAGTTGQGSPRQ